MRCHSKHSASAGMNQDTADAAAQLGRGTVEHRKRRMIHAHVVRRVRNLDVEAIAVGRNPCLRFSCRSSELRQRAFSCSPWMRGSPSLSLRLDALKLADGRQNLRRAVFCAVADARRARCAADRLSLVMSFSGLLSGALRSLVHGLHFRRALWHGVLSSFKMPRPLSWSTQEPCIQPAHRVVVHRRHFRRPRNCRRCAGSY